MTQLNRQIIAVLAAVSVLLSTTGSAVAATNLTISGNGSSSDNDITVSQSGNTSVVQSNTAVVTNTVNTTSSTGGNDANDNTGGDVMIRTGDAKAKTTIENTLNSNVANVDCCDEGDVTVTISGNGTDSDNNVELSDGESSKSIFQTNVATVVNDVDTDARTGRNDANRNTGGDVTIRTGDAMATSDVATTANTNVAQIGGDNHGNGQGLSAIISGNGSDSDNSLDLDLSESTAIVQDNLAVVVNDVDTDARTGANDANDNTGGDVGILTGDAKAHAIIDNMVNFNAADVDCGCVLDAVVKIAGNGTDSDNEIEAELGGDLEIFQDGNVATLVNDAETEAKTGRNESDANTGDVDSDPVIWTGDAYSTTEVENSGNTNVYGGDWHEFPGVDFNFNVAQLVALFGI